MQIPPPSISLSTYTEHRSHIYMIVLFSGQVRDWNGTCYVLSDYRVNYTQALVSVLIRLWCFNL